MLAVKRFGAGSPGSAVAGELGSRPPRRDSPHWRDKWYARLRGRPLRCQAQVEFDNLTALGRAGFRVPRPLGWAREPERGLSVVTMEWVRHRETLRERLERLVAPGHRTSEGHPGPSGREAEALLERLAGFVARFHAAGFYHRDLYLHHFVLPLAGSPPRWGRPAEAREPRLTGREPGSTTEPGGERARPVEDRSEDASGLCLLDLGRVRRERKPRSRWLIKDLGALEHSFPPGLPESMRSDFFQRYFDLAGPATLAHRDRWLRAIRRRAQRIAAHVPRHSGRPSTS